MDFKNKPENLVQILRLQGITNEAVLNAILNIPRHEFVPENLHDLAYENTALPIDNEQTISQPYIVARMTEVILQNEHIQNVLEIGTGSGYQAAVLSQVADTVYSIERIKHLLDQAKERFEKLSLNNIHTLYGDGFKGWPEHAPYDAILVTAATESAPQTLLNQLTENGRMIIPVSDDVGGQSLQLITRKNNAFEKVWLDPVRFVPLLHGID